ncbi:hypothetical protein K457DRAFT_521597 [Linnemannia elongata AG-77]|uniref:Uncharacterized protein n=1 Tax=Linnemannia elongata AG-77 TaxID=1314771 RepID=A0A197JY01_9FUNG|nr:hypothetical protein K457DRAFT_521597 [Linnemannia elongata AG-77]
MPAEAMDIDHMETPLTAEQIKAEANQEYKAGNYAAAVDLYSQSIKLEPTNATYYGNRSAALMMIKKYSDASKDCLTAVRLDPAFVKFGKEERSKLQKEEMKRKRDHRK